MSTNWKRRLGVPAAADINTPRTLPWVDDPDYHTTREQGEGRSLRPGLGRLVGRAMVLLLADARRLAAASTQVIELGAAHLAAAHDLDRVDHRRIERKDPLHPLAVGNLAHREVLVEARPGAADADALIGLDAGALALDHLDVDEEGVAGLEVRNVLAGGEIGNLLFFELLDQIHGELSIGQRQTRAARGLIGCAGRASFYDTAAGLSPFGPRLAAGRFGGSLRAGGPEVGPPRLREP